MRNEGETEDYRKEEGHYTKTATYILEDVADAIGPLNARPAEIGHVVTRQRIGDSVDLLPHRRADITEVDWGREGGRKE